MERVLHCLHLLFKAQPCTKKLGVISPACPATSPRQAEISNYCVSRFYHCGVTNAWIMFATNPVPTNINKWGFWWFLSNMIPYGMIRWIGHSKPRDWRDLRPRHSCSNRPRALQQQEGNLRWTVDPWDPLRICYFSDLLGGIMWDISDIKKNNDHIGSHSAASCRVRRPPRRVLRQPNSSGLQGVFDLFTKMQNDETQSLEHLRNLCFFFKSFFPDFLKFSWDDVMHDVRWSSSAARRASARVRLVPPEVIVGPWAKINMKKNMY